jgi:hypothetical protein
MPIQAKLSRALRHAEPQALPFHCAALSVPRTERIRK